MNDIENDNWFHTTCRGKSPKATIFCMPYAGGSATVYSSWHELLPSDIRVCAIQTPGHFGRVSEPLITSLESLVEEITSAIVPYLNGEKYFFFGHSMGARVMFEVACLLDKRGCSLPQELFVSGARSPEIPRPKAPIHALPDNQFVYEISMVNGTPDDVLRNNELLELLLPILRADFKICETWENVITSKLSLPIRVFGGLNDKGVTLDCLDAWQRCSSLRISRHVFPGGHFFINENREKVLSIMARYVMDQA